ncbi:uncharacterized protein LOC129975428 [Argiope bruennichi]|uniref:Cytochrome c oxidase assembly factor 1 like protein n=1 Tax=Argiope bruennichi TaxID=94029 RepID=A0A8T0ERD2_ARGBR|nr:uncharacterized protein LOC129975428 [Argiope bruennichi]KAF8777824.1 Cytochrome c oxidase assembly factor 1 like protein [Argiope bruennichi]
MLKVTAGRIIGIGVATCVLTSGSLYLRIRLEEKIGNQKLCQDCIKKMTQYEQAAVCLGEPIEWHRPSLANTYNYISTSKATIAIPVSGSQSSGELLIEASKEESEQKWTINSLKLKVPNQEITIQ